MRVLSASLARNTFYLTISRLRNRFRSRFAQLSTSSQPQSISSETKKNRHCINCFQSRPGARLKAPPPNAKLTKDKDALAKLKEVLDPDDIEFLRKKLLNDRRRVPKSLNLNNDSPRDLEFLLDDDRKPKTIPRTILPKEEIEKLKKRAQESSSPSQLSRDNLGRLELLLKGYL